MERFTLFCVISAAVTGLTSGAGVLPDIVNATLGGSVMFTPSLDQPPEHPFITILWTFMGAVNIIAHSASSNTTNEQYRDRITLFPSTGALELRNLAESDAGGYSVGIVTVEAGGIPGSTTLNIYEPVSNVKVTATSTELVEFNDTVTLSCSASGSELTFLWFNGSAEVKPSNRTNFTDGGANITIDPVLRYDQGSYTCRAFNPVSNGISGPVSLFISYGPEDVNLKAPPSDVYTEGSVVPLSCSADSRPAAQFYWLLHGQMFDSGAQIDLVIKQTGNYSCQAFNSKTQRYTTSQPAELRVFKKIDNSTVESSNHTIEGSSVNLTCDASGSIETTEWKFNGELLNPSENIKYLDEKRVLSFTILTRKDNGIYTCNISNPASSQSVDYIMKAIYGPENFKISEGPAEIHEGAKLTLSCSADSEPPAKYTWTLNGTIVAESQEYSQENVAFSDSGEYMCQATNEITMKSHQASRSVKVTARPPPRSGCNTGCIVGIVIGVIAVILIVGGVTFYMLKKKKQKPKSNNRTDGEGRDNSTYAQNQEVQYADVRFVKRGGVVKGEGQNIPEYAQVQKKNRPQASNLPSYDAHMQRDRRPDPESTTVYADVRVK